ncbi:hypothetical protein INR49_023092 [Caranx melampygus]|nr:hypothetical protein INR49_023092 [Caranx melampygus]
MCVCLCVMVGDTVMKDGTGAAEQTEVSRQELYGDYMNWYRQQCPEARPCCDARLLKKAAKYLLREPEPTGTFTVFPFYQALAEDRGAPRADCRRHLSAFIKATELLETLCVNLFLQPWKKEFKTLKSILASIGYLPHSDTSQSEFRLGEDADPDRAMLVGFELLLARVECYRLLEQVDMDQMGPQPQVPLYSDTRLAVKPQPKPRHTHFITTDQSIMEMQRIYPDLAFRGRRLVPDKPHLANSSRSSSGKAGDAAGHSYSDDSKDAELPKRDGRAAAGELSGDSGTGSGDTDRNSGGMSTTNADDDEVSGPPGIPHHSLHITLRAASQAERDLKYRESQQAAAGAHNMRPTEEEPSSLSTEDEERDLRELAQRMEQFCVQEQPRQPQPKRRGENRRREESTNKDRRRKERKESTEGEAEEQRYRKPVMETGPALSHDVTRCSRSSQADPAVMKEQRQPTVTDCQGCGCGGGSAGQQEVGVDPQIAARGQGGEEEEEEDEEPPQTFII